MYDKSQEMKIAMVSETFLNLKEDKKKKIIEKGIDFFANYSYAEISTNQITKELEISKGSLFSYFGSKKEFYLFLLDYCINQLLPLNYKIEATDFYDILFESMHNKMSLYFTGYRDYILFVNKAAKETNTEIKEEKDEILKKYMLKSQEDSQRVLNTAIATLNLKTHKESNLLLQGMTMYINTIMNRYLYMYKDSPEQLYENEEQIKKEIKEYLDLLLYGVIEDERN